MHPIINLDQVEFEDIGHGDKFAARDGQVAAPIGAKQLGCSLIVVPPGKRAYPLHCHHINEEMFVVLDGSGTVRIGESEHPIRTGDVIACPAGGAATAHQIINTSDRELRYLAISTMIAAEFLEYPDSGKIGINGIDYKFRGRLGARLDYWDGE
jgi:uncharacterized cupin superfamily protein